MTFGNFEFVGLAEHCHAGVQCCVLELWGFELRDAVSASDTDEGVTELLLLLDPEIEPGSPALQVDSILTEPLGRS